MTDPINIVESTLEGEAGHCHSFISSLCNVPGGPEFRLWVGRRAHMPALAGKVQIERHFYRKIRRLQAFFLYRKLLREPGRIFVSTAGRIDLMLLDLAARRPIPPDKVYVYFHWLRPTENKAAFFKRIAQTQPDVTIMGPTNSVADVFKECGFKKVLVVPYPISPTVQPAVSLTAEFRHLLFAGAARQDKGFSRIVDFLVYLAERRVQIPFVLQSSPDHYDKYDPVTKADMARLKCIDYRPLRTWTETLEASRYQGLFDGAVCLQPYQQHDFADRVSGITLDAFSAGAPVITLSGTWIARMVQRFDAGVVINEATPENILSAVQSVIREYARYHHNALNAGSILQTENSAVHLMEALTAER